VHLHHDVQQFHGYLSHVAQYLWEGPREDVELDEEFVLFWFLLPELLDFDVVFLDGGRSTSIHATAPLFPQVPQ
jgi:hypothetical protein